MRQGVNLPPKLNVSATTQRATAQRATAQRATAQRATAQQAAVEQAAVEQAAVEQAAVEQGVVEVSSTPISIEFPQNTAGQAARKPRAMDPPAQCKSTEYRAMALERKDPARRVNN